MYYDYIKELDIEARAQRRRMNNKKPVKSWQKDNNGTRECYGTSMKAIYEAYNESRTSYNYY